MKQVQVAIRALLPLAIIACGAADPNKGGFQQQTTGQTPAQGSGTSQESASGDDAGGGSSTTVSSTGPSSGSSGGTVGGGTSSDDAGGSTVVSSSSGGSTTATDGGVTMVTPDSGLPYQLGTISTEDIPVAAGAELVKCRNYVNPFGKDVAILESDSEMVSSHHMFVFHGSSFDMDTNSVADCSGIEFHDLVHLSQTPSEVIAYPTGVGYSLAGTDGLRLLVHLLNPTSEAITAKVTVNFHAVAPNQIQYSAVSLFLNNALLTVLPA